jgi:hypothetical protein
MMIARKGETQMLEKIVLITTICLALTVTTAEAQREGGAFFGPFASGGQTIARCASGYIVKRPVCNQLPQSQQKMKRIRR